MTDAVEKSYAEYLKGKRVVLVGPAGYLKGRGRGEEIDAYDVVVKMNWGETLPAADYGARTDVLYKRLLKLGHADHILVEEYVAAGVRYLIAVETRASASRAAYLKQTLGDAIPWFVDGKTRAQIMREMTGAPLLGLIAIRQLLSYEIASLTVVGCDLYETGYAEGYGGEPYRSYMRRPEGTMGSKHHADSQLAWLTKEITRDSRLSFDGPLTLVLTGGSTAPAVKAARPSPRTKARPALAPRAGPQTKTAKPVTTPAEMAERLETLQRLAGDAGENAIVELGVNRGRSLLALAAGSGGAPVFGVDLWDLRMPGMASEKHRARRGFMAGEAFRAFTAAVAAAGQDVTWIKGATAEVAKAWSQPIGLLHIDAGHDIESVRRDYEAWSPFIVAGGWLCFDDARPGEKVSRVIEETVKPSGLWTDWQSVAGGRLAFARRVQDAG